MSLIQKKLYANAIDVCYFWIATVPKFYLLFMDTFGVFLFTCAQMESLRYLARDVESVCYAILSFTFKSYSSTVMTLPVFSWLDLSMCKKSGAVDDTTTSQR